MTADVELLPSSVAAFVEALKGERGSLDAWLEVNNEREVAAHVEAYAHATAAKDAEIVDLQSTIEALRAEVERLTERNEELEGFREYADLLKHKVITCGVAADHPDAKLTRTGAYASKWNSPQAERVRVLRDRAERLAEALRFARTRFAPYMDDTDRAAFDAALHPTTAQENDDVQRLS